MTNTKKLHLVSLGCTKNLIDSEVMLGRLSNYAITDDAKSADVIIVNTCGFIDAAKQESIQTVLDLHEERKKDSLLVMSGCLSERYKEQLIETYLIYSEGLAILEKSSSEIKELIAFNNTPIGKKSNKLMPEIYKKGATIGARRINAALPGLLAKIKKRTNQLISNRFRVQQRLTLLNRGAFRLLAAIYHA